MTKTRLVIFDYDGVLLDTFLLTCHVYNYIFRHFKIEKNFTKSQFQDLFETDWKICLEKLGITKEKDIKKCEIFFQEITRDFEDDVRLYPDIKFVLEELKARGYKIAVVSNNTADQIIRTFEKNKVLPHFDMIVDINYGIKPDPKGIFKILKELNIKPEEAVMIGDMDGDILTAKNAKLKKAIAVTYGYHHKEKLKDADVIIDSPIEILEVLE